MDIGLWDKQSFANDQKLEIDQQFFKKMSMHKRCKHYTESSALYLTTRQSMMDYLIKYVKYSSKADEN